MNSNLVVLCITLILSVSCQRNITVKSYQQIASNIGNFNTVLQSDDNFGSTFTSLGDLDNDGIDDMAVGAWGDNDNGAGAVWILFMNEDGTVKHYQKISALEGGLNRSLGSGSRFGYALDTMGDFDGDGVVDIAVAGNGFVCLLFLKIDGTVKDTRMIRGDTGVLVNFSISFSYASVCSLGDWDGDGVTDIAVGNPTDDDQNLNSGAIYILLLTADGSVKDFQKISNALQGGFLGTLPRDSNFGTSIMSLGDLDEDGIGDVAVGSVGLDSGKGAVWILFLTRNMTVKTYRKIGPGGLQFTLYANARLGSGLKTVGDFDGDGVIDFLVGTPNGLSNGAFFIFFMNKNGTLKAYETISSADPIFSDLSSNELAPGNYFGGGTLPIFDSNGNMNIVVGASAETYDDGGRPGIVLVLFLNEVSTCIEFNSLCEYSQCQCDDGRVVVEDIVFFPGTIISFIIDFVTNDNIVLVNATISFQNVSATFDDLDLTSCMVRTDFNSRVLVENDLSLLNTSIDVYLSSTEKETIDEQGIPLVRVDGSLTGTYSNVIIYVNDEPDDSLELILSGNTFFLLERPEMTSSATSSATSSSSISEPVNQPNHLPLILTLAITGVIAITITIIGIYIFTTPEAKKSFCTTKI